jgi:hypothetical protein
MGADPASWLLWGGSGPLKDLPAPGKGNQAAPPAAPRE